MHTNRYNGKIILKKCVLSNDFNMAIDDIEVTYSYSHKTYLCITGKNMGTYLKSENTRKLF